jgi:hypothetical protein
MAELRLLREQQAIPGLECPLDRAIAYLEGDPAEALAEDYAARMEAVAGTWDDEAATSIGNDARSLRSRANGLREAACMLRDKESR